MNLKMAMNSLRESKLRTFLTLLGIIIGVTSVVTFISFGEGLKKQVTDEVRAFGKDFLAINPGESISRDEQGKITSFDPLASFTAPPLTQKDLDAIKKLDNIEVASGFMLAGSQVEIDGQEEKGILVMATDPDAQKIIGLEVAEGTFLQDDIQNTHIVVLGSGIKQDLFGDTSAIGRKVQIKHLDFTVIGVMEEYQSLLAGGGTTNFNRAVYIPVEAGKSLNQGVAAFMEIDVKVAEVETIDQTINDIQASVMNTRGSDDFTISKPEEFLDTINSILGILTTAVSAIASISVLVGGIGIMNIMFVTVSERTREIGIRKAIGATNNQIMLQFLIEAIVITILGAAIGVGIAAIISLIVGLLTEFSPSITLMSVIIATAASALFGVVFGIVPAVKAARKDPIESLRHD